MCRHDAGQRGGPRSRHLRIVPRSLASAGESQAAGPGGTDPPAPGRAGGVVGETEGRAGGGIPGGAGPAERVAPGPDRETPGAFRAGGAEAAERQ